ncbi:MAG: exodeoxyribonuclease VII large subunit, partial [Nostocoides sp.]
PDAEHLRAQLDLTTSRLRRAIGESLRRERRRLVELTSRPVLSDRTAYVQSQRIEIATLRRRSQLRLTNLIVRDQDRIAHLRQQAWVLSPQATLDRGYALVTTPTGEVISDQEQIALDDLLRVRVARGDFAVRAVAN